MLKVHNVKLSFDIWLVLYIHLILYSWHRCFVLPITLYGFQLWYYNKVLLLYSLKILWNMQRRATLWIVRAFCTLPTSGIEAIASLISIYLHIQKLNNRFHLRAHFLLSNYIINSMSEARPLNNTNLHHFLLE